MNNGLKFAINLLAIVCAYPLVEIHVYFKVIFWVLIVLNLVNKYAAERVIEKYEKEL